MEISYPNPGSSASFNNNRQQQQQPPRYSYPQVSSQSSGPPYGRPPPPVPSTTPSSRTGIRVTLKPEYRLAPPPQLLPLLDEIPQSTFQFDFDLERKILEEAQKEGQAGSSRRLSSLNRAAEVAAVTAATEDPAVTKYTMMGMNRDAVVLAIATYGDVQSKVTEFVQSYNVLREVGFEPDKIAGALAMFDNDKERASAYLIG